MSSSAASSPPTSGPVSTNPYADSSPSFVDIGNDMRLCYETFGDPADPTMLLVIGLGGHMIEWHNDLCRQLAAAGFHVVRFDNRDAGLSTHLGRPVDVLEVMRAVSGGDKPEVPYYVGDMAEDAVGLLDHLGVEQVHVVGMSLGGMIAQELTIRHEHRVASLTSVMSTTGDPDVGTPTSAALGKMLEPPPRTREEAMERGVEQSKVWGSEGVVDDEVRARHGATWDRDHDSYGVARQLAAILASGSRSERLRSVSVPTLAIHGNLDQLIQPNGSQRLVEVMPNAELLMIEGMGHDLAPTLWPTLVEAITSHAAQHLPRGSR